MNLAEWEIAEIAKAEKFRCADNDHCPSCIEDKEMGFGDDLVPWCCCRAINRCNDAMEL